MNSAPDIHNEPRIRDLNVPGRTLAVAPAQNAAAEYFFIEISRSIDVGNGDKKRDGAPPLAWKQWSAIWLSRIRKLLDKLNSNFAIHKK